MAIVEVLPGVCGFRTRITAQADEAYNVALEITSDCAQIRQVAEKLKEVAPFNELRLPLTETTPYRLAASCKVHAACPVPSAIIKAVEVAAGMALPVDVHISIRKE